MIVADASVDSGGRRSPSMSFVYDDDDATMIGPRPLLRRLGSAAQAFRAAPPVEPSPTEPSPPIAPASPIEPALPRPASTLRMARPNAVDEGDPPTIARAVRGGRVGFPAPQFSPPLSPRPFAVPAAPFTKPLPTSELAPTSRRPLPDPRQSAASMTPTALPSVAPVSMSVMLGKAECDALRNERTVDIRPKKGRSVLAPLAMTLVAGACVAIIGLAELMPDTFERAKATAIGYLPSAYRSPPEAQAPAALVAPTELPPPMPVPPVSAVITPVDPDKTLVTLPASARGHRVYLDGQPLATADAGSDELFLSCGTHTIKIGAAGLPRSYELPCGGELTIE